jgi:hypothetical protein
MALEPITDHVDRALARLVTQLRESASHRGLIAAIVGPAQSIEEALAASLVLRQIETATGAQLDEIGAVVGAYREGRTDDELRARVRVAVLVNRRSGEVETLIQIARLLLPEPLTFTLAEPGPATVEIIVSGGELPEAGPIVEPLREACAGGVRLIFRHNVVPASESFSFAGGPGLGFTDASGLFPGGLFAAAS